MARAVSITVSVSALVLACVSSSPEFSSSPPGFLPGGDPFYRGRWAGYDCEHGGSGFQVEGTEEVFFIEDKIDAFSDFLRFDPDLECEVACLDVELEAQRIGPGRFGPWGFATYKLVVTKVLSARPGPGNFYACSEGR
jgi:hypothetical protein